MWSYLVFSSYLFLLCGLRVMCHPNLIISDPDFHLHVGGLLNPIPGKLFSILQVCVRSFLKSSSVLRSLPEAISGTGVNAECANVPWQAYDCIWIERTYMSTHVQIKEHERRNTHLFYLALPSLPFSLWILCLLIVLFPNPLCWLQFSLKSFSFLNKIHYLSLCLSCVSFHNNHFSCYPLLFFFYLVLLCTSMWPHSWLFYFTPFSPFIFFLFLNVSPPHFFCLSTECQFNVGGWDGIIRSSQVEEEKRVKPGDALDCIWTIKAPSQSKVSTVLTNFSQ